LFSIVREPRLHMLDDDDLPLDDDPPARASARLGASARVRQNSNDSTVRHCSRRRSVRIAGKFVDMVIPVRGRN